MGDLVNPGFGSVEFQPRDKPGGSGGREDSQDGGAAPIGGAPGGGDAVPSYQSPRKAGVVIRATVEHMGLVGDTELTVNVKWPASTFCVPPCGKPATQAAPGQGTQQVPGNGPLADIGTLYGPSSVDTAAITSIHTGPSAKDEKGDKQDAIDKGQGKHHTEYKKV
jgi:hypothetical protein